MFFDRGESFPRPIGLVVQGLVMHRSKSRVHVSSHWFGGLRGCARHAHSNVGFRGRKRTRAGYGSPSSRGSLA